MPVGVGLGALVNLPAWPFVPVASGAAATSSAARGRLPTLGGRVQEGSRRRGPDLALAGADGATAPGRTGSRGARSRTRAGAADEPSSSEGRGRSIRRLVDRRQPESGGVGRDDLRGPPRLVEGRINEGSGFRPRRAPTPRHRNRRAVTARSGADSRAAPRGASARAAGGAAVVLERLADRGAAGVLRAASRPASRLVQRPEPTGPDEPDASRRRSCRLSFAVAFEHRLAHRAQGEACVPLQPVQMPFEARDRRQVHRGPRVPVQSRREARRPASRPAPPPRPRRRGRCLTASPGGRCPPRGPPTTRGHPRAGSSRREHPPSRRGPTVPRPSAPAL